MLIDAAGGIAGVLPGEVQADDLAPAVGGLVAEADAKEFWTARRSL